MDIFIYGIPAPASTVQLGNFLRPLLAEHKITGFEYSKPKNKAFAFLYIEDILSATRFLDAHTRKSTVFPGGRYRQPVRFERSKFQDSGHKLRVTKLQEDLDNLSFTPTYAAGYEVDPKQQRPLGDQNEPEGVFPFLSLSCGVWTYHDVNPVFMPYYAAAMPGKLHIGRHALSVVLCRNSLSPDWDAMIDYPYHWLDNITVSAGRENSILITGQCSPKFTTPTPSDGLTPDLLRSPGHSKSMSRKKRTTGIDDKHKQISGRCFVYRLNLADNKVLEKIQVCLGKYSTSPSVIRSHVMARYPIIPFQVDMENLEASLSDFSNLKHLPFSIRFQLLKFAYNGKLPPSKVVQLLPTITKLTSVCSHAQCISALRRLYTTLQWPQLFVPASEFALQKLEDDLFKFASSYREKGDIMSKHKHLKLIHHIEITPAGIYLKGPEPEVTNRVIRRYEGNLDSFVRVTFCEEDGNRVEFARDTSLEEVFHVRFKNILNHCISICGRDFAFLGFSGSSMKNHTAWFMAPVFDTESNTILVASSVIEELGDFAHIRVPAKCAARIGQTFTDTTAWIEVLPKATAWTHDIVHPQTKRVFSDGCGTISRNLLEQVWDEYPRLFMRLKPTVLQIRAGGAKGLVSLDPNLEDDMIVLRRSMWKFEARGSTHIEVCGMNNRPLPLYLNRPLIKILEDLGVPEKSFIELQDETVQEVFRATSNAKNAANFLEAEQVAEVSGIPGLIRRMNLIGINALEDSFLSRIVDAAAVLSVRDVKYRGRIKVKKGIKLYGIMDETGYLKENQIYCVVETPNDGKYVLCDPTGKNRPVRVAITRSPTMHPGDVQVVHAVNVPADSPLNELRNVVVFSQHGERDLASKLGGGDLDGDQFDVIYDPRLMPKRVFEAAEYPRTKAVELDRPVQLQDMSNFFVEFMENDKLGILSSYHLQLADRFDDGTVNPVCIALARLCSVAVDYAKSGIKVSATEIPRFEKTLKPDFMAPNPRVHIEQESFELAEQKPVVPDAYNTLHNEGGVRYYYSRKVLGKLFRRIDERKFYHKREPLSKVMDAVFNYVTRAATGVQWWGYTQAAKHIREAYEDNLQDTAYYYADRQTHPLLEVEVVIGSMFGATTKRGREYAADMKSRYERDVAYTRYCIQTDDYDSREEALPRAIACLALAMQEPGRQMGKEGPLVSFKYIAAAVCLEELERFHGKLKAF